jgi:hypothetical protein
MICRQCQSGPRVTGPMRAWSPDRKAEPHCARCGGTLAPEEFTERVREKESQLERFGLAGRTTPITTTIPAGIDDPAPVKKR